MARLIYNNQSGLLGASLTNVGTTITFASAPKFATLTGSDYIPLILSPATPNFEIVYLTAYTALATTGTITRAAEDSTNWPAVAHSDSWVCGPTIFDGQYPVNTPAGKIYQAGAQNLSSSGFQQLTLGSLSFVRGGMTGTSGNTALTVPVAGLYLCTSMVKFAAPGQIETQTSAIYQNGFEAIEGSLTQATTTFGTTTVCSGLILCSAGDVVTLYGYTGSTGISQISNTGSPLYNYLTVILVSAP